VAGYGVCAHGRDDRLRKLLGADGLEGWRDALDSRFSHALGAQAGRLDEMNSSISAI
jgi:hypothetical protein